MRILLIFRADFYYVDFQIVVVLRGVFAIFFFLKISFLLEKA